jgi:hypothetical protein
LTSVWPAGRVPPGPDVLQPARDESPAVISLITGGWSLAQQSVPATLLDLAARGYVAITRQGDDVVVHLPPQGVATYAGGRAVASLLAHERMVLDHVQQLAARSPQRNVPAAALTTGAHQQARRWWRQFRAGVHRDAMDRGLARRRVLTRTGLTDTTQGREAAAHWLGARAMLARDPRLASSQPSDVGVWGRVLAYGVAMGLAPRAAQGLPLRASSPRRAWSPVGGTWRPVRIRYPQLWGGLPPWAVLLVGIAIACPPLILASGMVRSDIWDGESVGLVLLAASPLILMAGVGVWACALAVLDFVTSRRTVEGEVLHIRRRRSSKTESWYVAVDDGTSDCIRAWWFPLEPAFGVGAFVRADVSRYLGHARGVEVLRAGDGTAPETAGRAGGVGGDGVRR